MFCVLIDVKLISFNLQSLSYTNQTRNMAEIATLPFSQEEIDSLRQTANFLEEKEEDNVLLLITDDSELNSVGNSEFKNIRIPRKLLDLSPVLALPTKYKDVHLLTSDEGTVMTLLHWMYAKMSRDIDIQSWTSEFLRNFNDEEIIQLALEAIIWIWN